MNLLAIRPPTLFSKLSVMISPGMPIGLAYVLGAIKDLTNIEVIDALAKNPNLAYAKEYAKGILIFGEEPDEILLSVRKTPDIVLISSMFSMEWPIVRELINKLKERYPDTIIIGGGEHFTALPVFSLTNSKLDIVVAGEGEATLREIISKLIEKRPVNEMISGIFFKRENQIVSTAPRTRIKEIDEIHNPAWELFNLSGYLNSGVSNTSNGETGQFRRAMPIVASRGCPYKCTFCSNPTMWGNLWRARDPEKVIDEMEELNKNYNVTHFDFADLTAIVNKSWIREFGQKLISRKLDITWGLPSGTRSEALSYEILKIMKDSGCNDLDYAPESGSEKILKIMKKMINKDKMIESINCCYRLQILTKANIILGYPEENMMDVFKTYVFIVRMAFAGLDDILITSLSIYPGSKIFENLNNKNKVELNDEYFYELAGQGSLAVSESYSNHYGKIMLYLFKVGGFLLFYLSSYIRYPGRLIVLIKDLRAGKGSTRLSMGLMNLSNRLL